jgi:hypothetical protein
LSCTLHFFPENEWITACFFDQQKTTKNKTNKTCCNWSKIVSCNPFIFREKMKCAAQISKKKVLLEMMLQYLTNLAFRKYFNP